MNKYYLLNIFAILLSAGFIAAAANAQSQTDVPKTEIGAFVTAIDLNKSVGEKPLGFGGRFTYNLNNYVAIDSEAAYYPQNPSGDFGETQALIGVRAGIHTEKIGVFAKLRPGLVRFGGDGFKAYNGRARNNFALDVGGVLEFYPTEHFIVRVDLGDTIIPFGGDRIRTGASIIPRSPQTTHNFQGSFGIGFRF